ncbi:MAG: hypothetical protein O4859_16900 [Trichodesmium sp. St18_bin1]|nr:hypothetical protein [Trichodesmium sp. St18_bin1]
MFFNGFLHRMGRGIMVLAIATSPSFTKLLHLLSTKRQQAIIALTMVFLFVSMPSLALAEEICTDAEIQYTDQP